jgi:pimeloyl-ACP methyl ester carboxylesterase
MGSRLLDQATQTVAWGAFEPASANPGDPDGARTIALPIRDDVALTELRDAVVPDGVLEKVQIRMLGIPLEVQAYAGILATLGAGGYRDEALGLAGEVDYGDDHFTCFQFAYDWRRDNVENARRLHEFIQEKQELVQREYRRRYGIEEADVRFDIAAHSMGGLVTRYFLRYGSQDLPVDGSLPEITWEGARYVDRVILIGTPNAGSAESFMRLVEGKKFAPTLPYYPPALLGTFPAGYQLLPRSRHGAVVWDEDPERPVGDLLDPALWERKGWGLAAPEQAELLAILMPELDDPTARRRIALGLQRRELERARSFMQALDRPAETPEGLELFLVAGDATPTVERVSVSSHDGSLKVIGRGPGDGTVLRSSALLDERVGGAWEPRLVTPVDFQSVLFLPADHLGLTDNETFRDNVLYWLLEEPRTRRTTVPRPAPSVAPSR